MEIRRDVSLGTGLIAAVSVTLAFGLIGLFSRMTPAVKAILEDNVESQSAAFDLLEALARREASGGVDEARLRDAIARARANITVEGEETVIAALEAGLAKGPDLDAEGLTALAGGARRLWDLNMAAMKEADARAVRLGAAGAWTAVFGGLVVIIIALLSWARVKARVIEPLEDISRVLHGVRGQQPQLRCLRSGGTSDIDQVRGHINDLLDDMKRIQTGRVETGKSAIRASLVTTLAHLPRPAAVVHHDGRIVAGNPEGLAFFGTRDGSYARRQFASRALRGLANADFDAEYEGGKAHINVHPIEEHEAALCILAGTVPPEPAAEPTADAGQIELSAEGAGSGT
jgi:hypothetical protein